MAYIIECKVNTFFQYINATKAGMGKIIKDEIKLK